jgi:hypothetical protein
LKPAEAIEAWKKRPKEGTRKSVILSRLLIPIGDG